jgi:two-component sensor histidine kinase
VLPAGARRYSRTGQDAAKYGVSSADMGNVGIIWDRAGVDGLGLEFVRTESGDLPVTRSTESGYGSQLIQEFGGRFRREVELSYGRRGVVAACPCPPIDAVLPR